LDANRFTERATIYEPNVTAEGMRHVLVNGTLALLDGAPTTSHAGSVLRR
jgi:N-acyl-D-aspartate/D-glutamate deacylase